MLASPGTAAGSMVVPTQVPASQVQSTAEIAASTVVPGIERPQLPTTPDTKYGCQVAQLMRVLVPFTRQSAMAFIRGEPRLSAQFKEDKFWMLLPLKIEAVEKDSMVGHKAPWAKADAATAIAGKEMYEASVNIDWLKPFCNSEDSQVLAGDIPTYEDLERL